MPKKISQTEFITSCIKKHHNKYNYDKTIYNGAHSKIIIICPIHGEFIQIAHDHKNGRGCPKCAIITSSNKKTKPLSYFLSKAKDKHHDKYDYSKAIFNGLNSNKIKIICPIHGEFEQSPSNHIQGSGCPKCGLINTTILQRSNTIDFIKKAQDVHEIYYDYSLVEYKTNRDKVKIICPIHGEFEQTPNAHLLGCGCPICGKEITHKNKIINYAPIYINKVKIIHNNKYDYTKVKYKGLNENIIITCPIHGEFILLAGNHLHGTGCPQCSSVSQYEDKIYNFLTNNKIEFIHRYRKIRDNNNKIMELDFFIPSLNIGIEIDGLYWHSENAGGKNKHYHINKTNICKELNIQLIHIFSDEFQNWEKIENRLRQLLNIAGVSIYARKCAIKELTSKTCNEFLNKYHLQNKDTSFYRIGLYYNNILVSVMTFSKLRKCLGYKSKDNVYELSRFCTLHNHYVVGGASKLLNHFIKKYNPFKIITYADRRWSNGEFYKKIGFYMDHISPPNYWYIKGDTKRLHRFGFRKNVLDKKLKIFDKNLTEWENMKNNRWDRIWDCGNFVFIKQ